MGKASSSKKVARAVRIGGGRTYRRTTPWGYFGIIALIVVLGVLATWTSRDRRLGLINNAGGTPPTVGTVWNEGYAVYACGQFLPAISIKSADPEGITTRTEGIIDIAPTVKASAGKNATLGKFASAVGMTLNAAELKVPGGHLYQDGESCEGKPGHVYVKQFAYVGDQAGQLYDGSKNQLPKLDPRNVPLANDEMLTIAFVPSSDTAKIPVPPTSVQDALKKIQASQTTTTTTAPATGATTVPTPSTTAKG
ncbi:MAG: hypothetical protein JO337_03340 [Acidimicrobiales bacterium]|nr:hypothetical protein [Acidimicrobiales bacterium]